MVIYKQPISSVFSITIYWQRFVINNIVYKYKLVRGISDQFIALELLEKKGFDKRLVKRAQDICRDISYKNKN